MKKAITKLSIHRTALTFALVMALTSLLFLIPMSFTFMNMPAVGPDGAPVKMAMPIGFMIAMPFLYFILTYIMTAIGSWVYNQAAKFTGGIQFEMEDVK